MRLRYGDPRVKTLVEDWLPPAPRLQASVLGCAVYHNVRHLPVASLGDGDEATLGLVYGVVSLLTSFCNPGANGNCSVPYRPVCSVLTT